MHVRTASATFILALIVAAANAADRRPLREARSENGRFLLRIQAGRGEGEAGRCRAALYENAEPGRRRAWRETFVNDTAPRFAMIRNDGRFVVTLDEFRRGGAAHALVVYGENGRLSREYGLRELLKGADWKHVKAEKRAVVWLDEAEYGFSETGEHFVVKLKQGREIRIDLEHAIIVGGATPDAGGVSGSATTQPACGDIPPEILALLDDPAASTQPMAGKDAERAADPVRQALLKLQRLAVAAGLEIEGLNEAAGRLIDKTRQPAGGCQLDRLAQIEEFGFPVAGNSASAGVAVPAPNPASPVDYLAWLREQRQVEGPSAVPYYQAAFEGVIPWDGDDELYDTAESGDPNALASPEIAAWLEANREALDNFRAATDYEYRGMPIENDGGLVLEFLLPHMSDMRQLSRMTVMEGEMLQHAGDVDGAFERYLDVMAAGGQAGQGTTLIENLVGNAVQALGLERTLDAMAEIDDEEIDYAALCESMDERMQPTRPIEETFQFEREMVLDLVQRGYEWNSETGSYRVREDGLEEIVHGMMGDVAARGMSEFALGYVMGQVGYESMAADVNNHFDNLTRAAQMSFQDGRRAFSEIERESGDPRRMVRNPIMAMTAPSLSRAVHQATRSETGRRATKLVANLKAYRQAHGDYPDSLEVFGDAEMVYDPFTDDYFAYRRDGDDFTLYSLSSDGDDDGGVHDPHGRENDLVYWPRPK